MTQENKLKELLIDALRLVNGIECTMYRGGMSGTIAEMGRGDWGYTTFGAIDENGLNRNHPVYRVPTEKADLCICRIDVGWLVGGKIVV